MVEGSAGGRARSIDAAPESSANKRKETRDAWQTESVFW